MPSNAENPNSMFNRETAGEVLRLFPDLDGSMEFFPINQGQANDAARLKIQDQSFILKRLPQGVDLQRQQYAADLQSVLFETGFPCPRLILNSQGQNLTPYAGRVFSLQTWLQGQPLTQGERDDPAPEMHHRLGAMLGQLHSRLAAADLRPAPAGAESSASQQFAGIQSSADNLFAGKLWRPSTFWRLRLQPGKTAFDEAVLQLLPLIRRISRHLQQWFSANEEVFQTVAPTHGDINWENLLFEDGQPVALLDFDNAKVQPVACELAAAVAILCPADGPFRKEFLAGYESAGGTGIQPEALQHLMLLKYCRSLIWQIPAWYRQKKQQPEIREWIIFLGKKLTDNWNDISQEGQAR